MLQDVFPDTSSKQKLEIWLSELRNADNSSPEGSPEALTWFSLQIAAKEVVIEERMKVVLRTELIRDMVKTVCGTETRNE